MLNKQQQVFYTLYVFYKSVKLSNNKPFFYDFNNKLFFYDIGVFCQIEISPQPTAVVNAGEELTITCTRTSNLWQSFVYFINDTTCFLTFSFVDPCRAEFLSCPSIQNYNFTCDTTHFNLTIRNVQRSLHGTNITALVFL